MSSSVENHRPRYGGTPNDGRTPCVSVVAETCSGSAIPVTVAAPASQTPNSWRVCALALYAAYIPGEIVMLLNTSP